MRRLTQEEVIERFVKVHGDRYDYSLVEYKNIDYKVKIICKYHGVFEQACWNHYKGHGCPHCAGSFKKTTKQFIKEAKLKHGDKYDYSLVEYVNIHYNIKIICPIHGVFEQQPYYHTKGSGCPRCSGRNKTTEDIMNEFKEIHGNRYDYSQVKCTKNLTKVKIICHKHGVFNQAPVIHLSGKGCPACGRKSIAKSAKENPTGWGITDWENKAKKSKNFDSFKVYIIRCWNDNEEFYKIGRTFTTVFSRFKQKSSMPYNYDIVEEIIFDNARDCFNEENKLKSLNKENKYLPLINFSGMNECFSQVK